MTKLSCSSTALHAFRSIECLLLAMQTMTALLSLTSEMERYMNELRGILRFWHEQVRLL